MSFTPTYLYIKRHRQTGLMYFGRTVSKNPLKYRGSGVYWQNHLKVYGNDVETIWLHLFHNFDDLTEFASFFSEEFDIVQSKKWANLIPEDGSNRFPEHHHFNKGENNPMFGKKQSREFCDLMSKIHSGKIQTEESKEKNRQAHLGKSNSKETREKISKANKGQRRTAEQKENYSKAQKGKPQSKVECPHCHKIGGATNMTRYHFDNCKIFIRRSPVYDVQIRRCTRSG